MTWATNAILIVSLVAVAQCDFYYRELLEEYIEKEKLRTFRELKDAEQTSIVYNLYELKSEDDFTDLEANRFRSLFKNQSVGVWLGNEYDEKKGGWFDPRTGGERNDYLNKLLKDKPTCPVCCLALSGSFKKDDPDKSRTLKLGYFNCETALGMASYWFPRTNKTLEEKLMDELEEQVEQIVSGKGPMVTIPFGEEDTMPFGEEDTMPPIGATSSAENFYDSDDERFLFI